MIDNKLPQFLLWDYLDSDSNNPGIGIMIYEPMDGFARVQVLHFNERWENIKEFSVEYSPITAFTTVPFNFVCYL